MTRYCEDCGTKTYGGGICPNCHEELYILTYHANEILSPNEKFIEKAKRQKEQLINKEKGEIWEE